MNKGKVNFRCLIFNQARSYAKYATLTALLSILPIVTFASSKNSVSANNKTVTISNFKEKGETNVAQQTTIKIEGSVMEDTGEPAIGARVAIKGTSLGTITDFDGNFSLNVSKGAVLVISYVGFETQEITIGNETKLKITLTVSAIELEEVVVTALGIKREEKSLGYASQKIKGDAISKVKGVEVASSLTGKISGVSVMNRTDFNQAPAIRLRGETPLLVVDGVPYQNIGLRDIAPDDIEDLTVLKGATASALYGTKGSSGAIMVTTKRGTKEGMEITVNSSTMFEAGYLRLPKVHHSYSSGTGGKYNADDDVWGDRLDIGRIANQHNPITGEWEDRELRSVGKDNFKNFLQQALVTKNNVSVAYKGANGSFRTSFSHTYNKGAFPNNTLNRFNYNVAGNMKFNKLTIDAGITYNNSSSPQTRGAGYGGGGSGPIYTILVWTATNYDLTQYQDYWLKGKEDQQQNWLYKRWYNNPYFAQYEATASFNKHLVNGHANITYDIAKGLKLTAKVGADAYGSRDESKRPNSFIGELNGKYGVGFSVGSSITSDMILLADKKLGDFDLSAILGTGSNYFIHQGLSSSTAGGLIIPGYYSLKASVDPATTNEGINRRLINSVYGRASVGWKSMVYLEATGRNDWVSTLNPSQRSFFYPSVSGSFVASELLKESLPDWFNFWKIRGSWTVTKMATSPFEINKVYGINVKEWDGISSSSVPSTLLPDNLRPRKSTTFEMGTDFRLLNNRLRLDLTYYSKVLTDRHRNATISQASGYSNTKVNFGEEIKSSGVEFTTGIDIIKTKELDWTTTVNWSRERTLYKKIDELYSTKDKDWVAVGKRVDFVEISDWERTNEGELVHGINGLPRRDSKKSVIGYHSPDWYWGISNEIQYKNFTLNFTFDGRVGGIAFNKTEQSLWQGGGHIDSDTKWRYEEVVNGNKTFIGQGVKLVSGEIKYTPNGEVISDSRKFAPNDVITSYQTYMKYYKGGYPSYGSAKPGNFEEATFLKLRELSIGYNVPKSIANKLRLNDTHIAFVGQNLLLWTKAFKNSDPDGLSNAQEEDLSAPSVRYMGINLKFSF